MNLIKKYCLLVPIERNKRTRRLAQTKLIATNYMTHLLCQNIFLPRIFLFSKL
jgi:hypothetical protein